MSNGRIKRSSDVQGAKLPILGKIRVGMKTKIQKGNREIEIPTSLDYFIATGKYAEKFNKAFGNKPNTIGITFATNSVKDACNERFELRDPANGTLIGKGDGETFEVWNQALNNGIGGYDTIVADNDDVQKTIKSMGTWNVVLTLKFIIPKINDVFGVWVFETKGKMSSIPNIRDTFDNVLDAAGSVINIPFDLSVDKVSNQTPGQKRKFSVVSLIPNVGNDKLDDIRGFLNAGNNVRNIAQLLSGEVNSKQIEQKPKLLDK